MSEEPGARQLLAPRELPPISVIVQIKGVAVEQNQRLSEILPEGLLKRERTAFLPMRLLLSQLFPEPRLELLHQWPRDFDARVSRAVCLQEFLVDHAGHILELVDVLLEACLYVPLSGHLGYFLVLRSLVLMPQPQKTTHPLAERGDGLAPLRIQERLYQSGSNMYQLAVTEEALVLQLKRPIRIQGDNCVEGAWDGNQESLDRRVDPTVYI